MKRVKHMRKVKHPKYGLCLVVTELQDSAFLKITQGAVLKSTMLPSGAVTPPINLIIHENYLVPEAGVDLDDIIPSPAWTYRERLIVIMDIIEEIMPGENGLAPRLDYEKVFDVGERAQSVASRSAKFLQANRAAILKGKKI